MGSRRPVTGSCPGMPIRPGPTAAAARTRMAWAALLSGICLANAGLGAVHGLAAPIGALLPIAHGAACGAILGATVRANIHALTTREPDGVGLGRYATAGRLLAGLDAQTTDVEARDALVTLLHGWSATLGAPSLRELGLRSTDVDRVLAGVSTELDAQQPRQPDRDGAPLDPPRLTVRC